MTIEPTEFDMVAVAGRGLQVLIDGASAEHELARRFAMVDSVTLQLTPESVAAKAEALRNAQSAYDRMARFNVLYPKHVAA